MRAGWDDRAKKNAYHYVSSFRNDWDCDSFFAWGEDQARKILDTFLGTQGIDSKDLIALEIGCGPGRMSRALSKRFRLVFAYDVSSVMVQLAADMNHHLTNVVFATNDGESFPEVKSESMDFVFSGWTIQHMPTNDVVRNNVSEISRMLNRDGWYLIDLPMQNRWSIATRPARSTIARGLAAFGIIDPMKVGETWSGTRLTRPAVRSMLREMGLTMNTAYFDESPNTSRKVSDEWTFGKKAEPHVFDLVTMTAIEEIRLRSMTAAILPGLDQGER